MLRRSRGRKRHPSRPKRQARLVGGLVLLGLLALNAAASFAATKITIAVHFEAGQIEYLEPYVQEYQRLHPEVEIELLSTPFAEFLPKLQVM